jgi:hypothetical protein
MTASGLLSDLQARGVRLQVSGERLRIEAPSGVLTPELREILAAHKAELLGILRREQRTRERALGASPILALPLDAFATSGQMLEIYGPRWQDPLWFVPTERDAEELVREGITRGRIWTAGELRDLLTIPALTKAGARTVAEAKLAVDGDVTAVRAILTPLNATAPPLPAGRNG